MLIDTATNAPIGARERSSREYRIIMISARNPPNVKNINPCWKDLVRYTMQDAGAMKWVKIINCGIRFRIKILETVGTKRMTIKEVAQMYLSTEGENIVSLTTFGM